MSDQPNTNTAPSFPQPEEGVEPDDLNAGMVVAVGLISTALVLCSVLGVMALVDQYEILQIEEKSYARNATLDDDPITAQRQTLSQAAVVNADQGVYRIPIDQAKKLVVQELSQLSSEE